MNFPSDHYWHHGEYDFEWCYFWGKLENGKVFHFTEHFTKLGGLYNFTTRYAFDGKFIDEVDSWKEEKISTSGYAFGKFTFSTPTLGCIFEAKCKPIIHPTKIERRNYYSIPRLEGSGHFNGEKINATAWFDHEFSDFKKVPNWDWVSVKLDCGMDIMAFQCDIEPLCDITFGDKMMVSNFILEGKHFFIHSLGMYLILEPVEDEVVFKPRLGVEYSEQPFNVISKGGKIGNGMRERTYMEVT